ncbi:hypothetical protein AB0O01_00340 [Streptomyces sp. NPDC093252]|uniref:hypothetical protein n=1 Tax=Streptomyces sp. NPDC093252 TaxID=3154980 RepID=UPI00342E9D59
MAGDLALLTGRLVALERLHMPLRTRLDVIDSLRQQSKRCTAAMVHEARLAGAGWEDVATAANVTAQQAATQWDTPALRRLFPPKPVTESRPSVQQLAGALAHLQAVSDVSVDEAAERSGLSLAYVMQVLEGRDIPSWPEVYTLASVFAGRAEDLRILWESATGSVSAPHLPADGAAGYLFAALRGLHLAAGTPAPHRLSTQALLPAECLAGILSGQHIPPWQGTARLVRALGGRPEDVHPLWEAARQAADSLMGTGSSWHPSCPGCRADLQDTP